MEDADNKGQVLFMGRVDSNLWETSEAAGMSVIHEFASKTDVVNGHIDTDMQEWTNEDMAETNETIQMLEKIVKAQLTCGNEVPSSSSFFVPVTSSGSPIPANGRPNGVATDSHKQFSVQYQQRQETYERNDGKDFDFEDEMNAVPNKPFLSRNHTDDVYIRSGHDNKPPRSPASGSLESDNNNFESNNEMYFGKGITDPHLSDTVERASSKLRKFQLKIIRTIELSPEVIYKKNKILLDLDSSVFGFIFCNLSILLIENILVYLSLLYNIYCIA